MATVATSNGAQLSSGAQRSGMAVLLLGFCAAVLLRAGPATSFYDGLFGRHGGIFQGEHQSASPDGRAVTPRDLVASGESEPVHERLRRTVTLGEMPPADEPARPPIVVQHALLAVYTPPPSGGQNGAMPAAAGATAPAKPLLAAPRLKPRYPNDGLIAEQVLFWSRQRSLDPLLVWMVIDAESGGDPRAVSREGALGLMQVMPFHFRPGEDPFDIATNIQRGTGLLAAYLSETGSTKLALAAYSAGPAAVRRHGGVPPYAETHYYLTRTFDRYVSLSEQAAARAIDPFSLRYAVDP